ncbi:MAG TPA: hypothetical protein VNH82_10430 [Candidatus Dormibacteraeota bacterium]|nr:hypothetical protein [Candidatus Dormibacteraeota bacterium]
MPSDAGPFIDDLLAFDGIDDAAAKAWADRNGASIVQEAASGTHGVISGELDRLIQLADSNSSAAAFGFAGLFSSLQEVATAAFHKVWGFVSAGAGHFRPLWNALAVLFHRYSGKLKALAKRLGADGYTLALNIPVGFSCGLTFAI